MRNRVALLLKCAALGLAVAGLRPALGAEAAPLKLRMSGMLADSAGSDGVGQTPSALAVEQAGQREDAPGLVLQLSKSTTDPLPPDDNEHAGPDKLALEPPRPAAAKSEAAAPSGPAAKSDGGAGVFGLGLAPVRWGGYTTDIFRMTKSSDTPVSMNHAQRIDLRATSYLWQPWLATVSGGLGYSRGVQDSGDRNGETKSDSLTGFGDLSLFPQSRFPFSAAFSVSDSSTSSALTTNDTQNKRFSLRQSYRPETGNTNYTVSYQNSTVTSKQTGNDVVETWQGTYSTSLGNQNIGLDADHTVTSRSQNQEGLVLNTLNARHSYSPGSSFSIESNARMSDSMLRLRNASAISANSSTYYQAGSFATWHPRESLPLNLTAGVNFFNALSDVNGVSNETQSMNGNLAATYNPTRNLTLGASGAFVAATTNKGPTKIVTTESGNAAYSGDPLTLGNFSYNWNVSGNATNQTSDSGSTQTMSIGGGHGLNREYRLSEHSSLHFGANQSLSVNWAEQNGQSSNLSSGGTLSWQIVPSESMSGSVSLSATDTRTIGNLASDNQFVSLQSNGRIQLSTYAAATANFNIQWNHQGETASGSGGAGRSTIYTSGSATYQNSRAFGINNLRYSLLANINMQQTNARLLGDVNADTNPLGYSLEQHLDYRIGRIDMGLTGTVSMQSGKENALLFLQVGRTFGNY